MSADRNNEYGGYSGRWPAVVKEYDGKKRMCRVSIPGITDGAETLPWAEIEYPIGDKSISQKAASEIEMLPEDPVWVAFIGGDPRNPIITGYRNARKDNETDWRRWHHKNVGLAADERVQVTAGADAQVKAGRRAVIDAGQNANIYAGEKIGMRSQSLSFDVSGASTVNSSGTVHIRASTIHLN